CRIESIDKEQTTAILLEERPAPGEPRQDIRLFLAYMKADKMEWVAQKATELGVSAFCPFISSRCVKVPVGPAAEKAAERQRRISYEALKQCGRTRRVDVHLPISFEQLLGEIEKEGRTALFAYEASEGSLQKALNALPEGKGIDLIVGPEGGFSEEEARCIVEKGALSVSLGRRILRGETAAIALLAIAGYETGC
ncbi:MAG: 16S rRNA (uracil(1498)-N(3))-methyltransferase, partial [Christensenellaceae bacterium]|nr:16S rRNA (uracil(1498)-N(3))-methyltransferase [Christensenellaceae bacterium]